MEMKGIPGYDGLYVISDEGAVFGIKSGSGRRLGRLKSYVNPRTGYECIQLTDDNGNKKSYSVHKLVCLTYIGQKPDGKEINHKDNNKLNNKLNNLEYVTHSENVMKSFQMGRPVVTPDQKGEAHAKARLTNNDIYEIRGSSKSIKELSVKYGVCTRHINYIKSGTRWSHL